MYALGMDFGSFNPFKKRQLNAEDEDQTPSADRIPHLWWTVGLFLSTIMSCAILATQFNMSVGEAILALVFGFLFSFIAVQSSGATDINPVSTVAKVSAKSLSAHKLNG
jgi:purine-cytosine permease-like protein